jgi:AcrR family transcriptional regulator
MGDRPPKLNPGIIMPRLPTATKEYIFIETRQRLLETAASEFASNGFTSANINHISTLAGYAKGTIYNYFSSKRDLMLALIDEIGAKHTDFIVTQVMAENDPIERMRQFFRAGFAFVEQYPRQARIAISVVYGHEEEFKQRIYQTYERLFSLIIQDIVEAGITRGDFKPIDSDKTAAMLMSLYLGSCSQLDSGGKIFFDPDQVAAFVLEGLQLKS